MPGRLRAGPGSKSRPPPRAIAAGLLVGPAVMLVLVHAAGAAAHHVDVAAGDGAAGTAAHRPDAAAFAGNGAAVLVTARVGVRAALVRAARTAACSGCGGAVLAAGRLPDVERWRAFFVMLSLPRQSAVGLSSEPSLSRAWMRLWPRPEEGYRTVAVSYWVPSFSSSWRLWVPASWHTTDAEATRRWAPGCGRGAAAAAPGGGACARAWSV